MEKYELDPKTTDESGPGVNVNGSWSASFGSGKGESKHSWIDINGDGLVDRIEQNGTNADVYLNKGAAGLSPAYDLSNIFGSVKAPYSSSSTVKTPSLGLSGSEGLGSVIDMSFSVGIGSSHDWNIGEIEFVDLNGDGLVDQFVRGSDMFYINTGTEFVKVTDGYLDNWNTSKYSNLSAGSSSTLNGSFTVSVLIPLIFKINATPGGTKGTSTNRKLFQRLALTNRRQSNTRFEIGTEFSAFSTHNLV